MFRKILFLCLTLFMFISVNAQTAELNIVTVDVGCGDNTYEFEGVAAVNGKNAYVRTTSLTALGAAHSAIIGNNTVGIEWDGLQWAMYYNGDVDGSADPANHLYVNPNENGVLVPNNGWVPGPSGPCGAGSVDLFDFSGAVLPVDKEIYSKMSLYPNPSNGFVNISNLDAPSRVVITNIAGQIVRDVKVNVNSNRIDIQNLSKGFYFVEIEGKKTIKLIKQ